MHYPIPPNFTLDGYSVSQNYEISTSDKQLVAELYPFNKVYPETNTIILWSKLQDLNIEYNVTENGKAGMKIKQDFMIYNAKDKKCIMAVYFYDADNGLALTDHNGQYTSSSGNVAGYNYFTPVFPSAQFSDLSIFIPYDELELGNGNYRLKCYVALFDNNLKQITTGGYQYFTFAQGANSTEVKVRTKFNDATQQIEITPMFTIENAKDQNCHAVAYFYSSQGVPLKDSNSKYHTTAGTVASTVDFNPGYPTTLYNNNQVDFIIYLPYNELHLPKGFHRLEYRVVLYDSKWAKIVQSELFDFTFQQD